MSEAPPPHRARSTVAGIALLATVALGAYLDRRFGWFAPAFTTFTRLLDEPSTIARIRLPSQTSLARVHFALVAALAGLILLAGRWLSREARLVAWMLLLGYVVRAGFCIAGGNLPLVPGDSSHYVEVARSIHRGEGPVKHYVESYFVDYRRHGILEGRGVLDDWATPLWSYVLAAAYRITGVVPGDSMDATFAVAKGASFLINWLTLPVLYIFTRRWYGPRVALAALGVLAILPVHALYAGMALRESLVALTSLIAVAALVETWRANGRESWTWAVVAGITGGFAILARNTGLALVGAAWLYAALGPGRRRLAPLALSGLLTALVILPWAWATYREYGEPFFTYTKYYPYNFSWTVHHYDQGNTRPDQFYKPENLPGIVEAKLKSLVIVPAYTALILGLPLAAGFILRNKSPERERRVLPSDPSDASPQRERRVLPSSLTIDIDRLPLILFLAFLLATLVQIVDVTQVRQLGRYYLPVYMIMLPTAAAGLTDWAARNLRRRALPVFALTLAALLWTGPGWAYDFTWYGKPFQARWPALADAGLWMRDNLPPDARILTWFPWELRVTGDRTTILFPRALEAGPYEAARLRDAINRYRPTHVLWGAFEPAPETDPESLGRYLETLRAELGIRDSDLMHASPPGTPHPVRLYRLRGGGG